MIESKIAPSSHPVSALDSLAPDFMGQLLMLASSNLPIGSYTYSQGIEPAIESGLIYDESSTLEFMLDYLELALVGFELPLLALMLYTLTNEDATLAEALAADYHASRESKEFVYESKQLAISLSAWLNDVLELEVPKDLLAQGFLPLFATLSAHWKIPLAPAITTYAFGQIENMVLAAVKTVPLGQMAGQRIIWQLQQRLATYSTNIASDVITAYDNQKLINNAPSAIHTAEATQEDSLRQSLNELYQQLNMSANLPYLAQLSCQHERQYSRLFRS